jgi:putative tryptophan/tyrosine transport system substrate-binding protein
MRRREFIGVLSGAITLWPLLGIAQQGKAPTIAVLVVGSPGSEQFWQLFQKAMRALGYVDGQSIRYEFRSDQGHASRLPELAAELVPLKVDLIVTWFTPAAEAAKRATHEIPIVMALAGDPVGTGLVESLNRPGGNVTGMAGVTAELAGKSVEIIRELLPTAHHVVALANAPDPFSKPFLEYIRLAGTATSTTIDPKMVHSAEELEAAFSEMAKGGPMQSLSNPACPVNFLQSWR